MRRQLDPLLRLLGAPGEVGGARLAGRGNERPAESPRLTRIACGTIVTVARGVATMGASAASGALGPPPVGAPCASGFLVLLPTPPMSALALTLVLASALPPPEAEAFALPSPDAGAGLPSGSGRCSSSERWGILRIRVHARLSPLASLSEKTYVLGVMALVE